MFIFTGYKLLPIFQAIYSGMIAARSSFVPVDNIYNDLKNNKVDYKKVLFIMMGILKLKQNTIRKYKF